MASMIIILAALFGVGITASVKIGGGSNLHNLDMFLVTLLLLAIYAVVQLITKNVLSDEKGHFLSILITLVLTFPITYSMRTVEKPDFPEPIIIQEAVDAIRNQLAQVDENDEVLFIDHRQLLTFNIIPPVPLIDAYEKKNLMNEAISGNEAYFQPFYKDISSHRFAMIITEPLNVVVRGEDYSFGNENDEYVKWVTIPLVCKYKPVYTNLETAVEILVPRLEAPSDPSLPCDIYFNSG